ncbi:methyl-accepting chemotaxis protein [Pseudanabaena yagii]|uniref:Methyl-accepting transducer domain-containing protein n=1 Tax=Pseudanabaena yagii GIHE-NHR1 TaxID=2722753 RepID=A0ABX1LX52_9CYAN|nr:methyl-accepting chemotaxis protein [Pseudanabaena yagii]NMF60783.1 hypothetical protein [Pseudanabaena yagii GIHE-NHR1]
MASTPKTKTATSVGKSAQENSKQRSPKSPKAAKQGSQQGKPKGSIGLGLLLIAIGTSLIGLGGLGYLFYQELLSSSKREVSQSAELQSTQIESKLNSVRQAADGVALNAKALSQQAPKPKTVDQYQKLVIDGFPKSEAVAGIGIAQNENLLFTVPKPTVPYVLKEQSGLKLEGATQKLPAPNDKLLAGNRTDFQNSPLYKSPITKSKEAWSEPYSALGKTIVTYSSPILDGQKVLGVVNADAIANNLVASTNASANSESKVGFVVVSASGKVITSSDQLATQLQNPATTEAIKNLAQQAKAQPTGIAQTGGNLWAYRKIEGSDWIVAASLPESEITNKLLILVGGAAIGISTILAIAILSFVNSLKKRLQPLTEECDRFLAQQGATKINIAGKDEIDQLGLSLKNTLQKAKTSELRLRSEASQAATLDDTTSAQIQQSFAEAELMEEEVGNLLDVVSSMEEGDLTVEAQVNDRATGLVADTLNRLREKLIEVISSVLGTAQQVAQGASDLEALAQTVVLNTAEQAQSVAQGQALTAQVAAIAQRSSEQVSVANQSLQGVRDTVTSGQTAIDNLTESISVLQTGSAQIVQRMKTLGEFVGLAEQFVQDQGQIAQLTQVLALNATLVASRAAEQKDPNQFAGVAREFEAIAGQVNDLATQTNEGLTVLQQRTSQIQTVVTAIDAEVQNLSGLVSGFTTGVESSQFAFHSIQIATEEVVQIGQTITDSSLEITEAAGSTASYISEIAQLADRTADLTRAARQQAEAMGNQAQQLLQGIQFFRLPEGVAYTNNAQHVDADALSDRPETEVNSLFDAPSESSNTGANGNLVVPAIAVAAAATAVAISQSGQNAEAYTAPEDFDNLDNTATDNQYLQSLLDDRINEDSTDYALSDSPEVVNSIENVALPQEQSFASTSENFASENAFDYALANVMAEDDAANNFLDTPPHDESQAPENVYSELTDISVIEESLLADLRHEIYDELSEDEGITDQEDVSTETHSALKNPMEGVDEFSISEASSDPLIISATSSFMEDTAFGNPSPLSEESLANLPTSVDFSIPDLDDHDFEIPKIDIESTLDNSNSFFDASSVQTNEVESSFDPFAMEQSTTDTSDYATDDVFTLDDQGEDLNDNINENISEDLSYNLVEDIGSGQFEDYNVDDFSVNPSESYDEYTSHDEFAQSLEGSLEGTPNEAFNDTFDTAFDETPFDPAFGEALTSYNAVEPSLEPAYDSFADHADAQFETPSSEEDYSFYDQFEAPANLEADALNEQITDLASEYIPESHSEDSGNFAGLPNVIPDVYLEDVTEEALPDEFEFDFQENLSAESSNSNLDDAHNIFDEPSFELEPTSEESSATNADFGDPFYVADLPELSEEDEFIEQQNYLFTETAIAPETSIQANSFLDSASEEFNEEFTFDLDDHATNSDELETPHNIFEDSFAEANAYEDIGEFANPSADYADMADQLNQLEASTNDFDTSNFYQESEEFADNFELDNLASQADAFVPEISIASESDQQNAPTAEASLDEASTEFNFDLSEDLTNIGNLGNLENLGDGITDTSNIFDESSLSLSDEEFTPEDAIEFDTSQQEELPQVEIADLSNFNEDISEFAFPDFSDMNAETDMPAAIADTNFADTADTGSHDQFADLSDPFSSSSSQFEMPDFSGDALLEEEMDLDTSDDFDSLTLDDEVPINSVEMLLEESSAEDSSSLTDDAISIDNWDDLPDLSAGDAFTVVQADVQNEISAENIGSLEETSEWEEETFFDSLSSDSIGDHDLISASPENPLDMVTSDAHDEASAFLANSLDEMTSEVDNFMLDEESSASLDSGDNDPFDFSENWLDEAIPDNDQNIDGLADLSIGEYPSNLLNDLESDNSNEPNYGFADDLLDSLMDESDTGINDLSTSFPDLSVDNSAIPSEPSEHTTDMANPMEMLADGGSDDRESQFDFDFSAFDELIDDISNPTPASLDSINSNPNSSDTSSNSVAARAEIEDFLSGALGLDDLDDEVSAFQDNISVKPDEKKPNPNKPVTNDKA